MEIIGEIWLQGSLIFFGASLIQVLTGFGFGLVAVPLLLFILPSQEALWVSMILSLFSFVLHGMRTYKEARWDLIGRLLLISIPSLVLGVILSRYFNSIYIKGIVGTILIFYVIWQWVEIRKKEALKRNDGVAPQESEEKLAKDEILRKSPLKFYSAGFVSGLLNGLAAIPGPPIVALLVKNLNKDTFHATTVNFFILQYSMTLGIRFIVQKNVLTPSLGIFMICMIFPILLGHCVGHPIRGRINEQNFKKLVYFFLFIMGITSAWEPIQVFLF